MISSAGEVNIGVPLCAGRLYKQPGNHVDGPGSDSRYPSQQGKSLLLLGLLDLALAGDDLSEHDNTVAIHEGDTGEALAVLEGVAHEGLLRLEAALSHLVGLEGVRLLHLLATGLLAHLPLQGGDTAGGAAAAHEADRGVADLDLVGDVENLDLGIELAGLAEGGVLLVDHDVTGAGHVVLVKTLDVEADVVARVGCLDTLVVHLDGEDLASARVGGGVGGQEDDFLTRLHDTLLDTSGEDITDTLDLVDAGDGHAHRGSDGTLRHAAELLKDIVDGVAVDGLLAELDVLALPPVHLVGLLEQVVAHPSRDGEDGGALLNHG